VTETELERKRKTELAVVPVCLEKKCAREGSGTRGHGESVEAGSKRRLGWERYPRLADEGTF
jgi:hypothetical protein